ncbi:hypothetical protein CFP65_3282 [Kitasatospora sp. MMS16-BH015]|uniref:hypothetical protein n=1 Tax=Kitasatospora sp. MMS16-BH015 TaxID=2018025 RepID=UPI000CA32224|nr:hypothetical protein [Kitasatospora sp. MMS16-BH015]AUG78083.1 hypothetical protein CFP65_3282 [Kitasatospora sp. MMS16-BH015]
MTESTEQPVAVYTKRPAGSPRLVTEPAQRGASQRLAEQMLTLMVEHDHQRAEDMLRTVKDGAAAGRYAEWHLDAAIVEAHQENGLPVEDIAAALDLSEDHVQDVLDQAEGQDDEGTCAVTQS